MVIYTTLFGATDKLQNPLKHTPRADYVCFTDDPSLKSDIWNIELVPAGDSKRLSRFYKVLSPFKESLYLDSSFQIRQDLTPLINRKGFYLSRHPMRNCAYKEAEIVINKKLDKEEVVVQQMQKYEHEGFPKNYGLWRCGIMLRTHNELDATWHNEITNGSWRDQISFPYACWKTGISPRPIMLQVIDQFFSQSLHLPYPTDQWKFVGEGTYDKELEKSLAHVIILKNGILFPKWVNNYISLKYGVKKFVELIQTLNGTILHGKG